MDIVSAYSHSKIGQLMFKLCAKATKGLVKHR